MKTYEKDLKEIMTMFTDDERQNMQDCADTFYEILHTFGCDTKGELKFKPVEYEGYTKEVQKFLRDARVTYETLTIFKNMLSITGYIDKNKEEDY